MIKLDTQVTGNIGMYFVCYRLSCLGWNVMPTSRNARGIDIIIYNKAGDQFKGIQVKTLTKRNPVPLGKSLDKIMGDHWVIVNNLGKGDDSPNIFILDPAQVKAFAHEGKSTTGEVSYWLQPAAYDKLEFKDQWLKIGHGHT
jgi:hypothetical protein